MNSSSMQWGEMKLTSMHGEFWSLFMSEVARLTKRQTFISFIVMKYLVCKPLLFKLPLMQISKVITLQIVKAFCSRAALANSLIYFSSVEFTPGSFNRNRCLRLGVLNNNSNCFKRAYQIWLIMTAYSCKIFFFLGLSWISTSCHRVQPALPAGGKIRYDRRWTCHVDGGGEKTQTLQEKRFSFQNHDVFLSSVFLEIKTFNCAAAISFWLPFTSLRLSSLFVVLAQR